MRCPVCRAEVEDRVCYVALLMHGVGVDVLVL